MPTCEEGRGTHGASNAGSRRRQDEVRDSDARRARVGAGRRGVTDHLSQSTLLREQHRWDVVVDGVTTVLDAADEEYLHAVGRWLRPAPGRSQTAPKLTFRLTRRPGQLPDGPPARIIGALSVWWSGGRVTVALDGTTGGYADLTTGDGEVWSGRGRDETWRAVHLCLRALWLVALGRHGLHAVHSAAVELDGRAVVLMGPSGSGKSTLAWHLASLGAGHMSDDVVLLGVEPPRVTGLADRSRLHPDGAVGPHQGDRLPDGKVGVAAGDACRRALPAGAIILLEDRGGARPERRAPADAMTLLLRSGFLMVDPPSDGELLAAMAAFAGAAPVVGLPRHLPLPDLDVVRAWTGAFA